MKHRKLRIAWSVGWGVVAVLLCVLWVRSYWRAKSITVVLSAKRDIIVSSSYGGVHTTYVWNRVPPLKRTSYFYFSGFWWGKSYREDYWRSLRIFDWSTTRASASLRIADWFLILVTGSLAAIGLRPAIRFRFGLRTLLIATTLVAVALGLIVWARRSL